MPNLVNVVKGFAQQEKDVLLGVTEARSKVGSIQATPELVNDAAALKKFSAAQGELSSALSRLLVVTEKGYGKRTPLSEYAAKSRAIAGVATFGCGEATGFSEMEVLARAARAAVADAGLKMSDIDGLCTASVLEKVPPHVKGSGAGWLTAWLSEMMTLSEPCDTAAGLTFTPSAITTVPVRELKITRGSAAVPSTLSACSWATTSGWIACCSSPPRAS